MPPTTQILQPYYNEFLRCTICLHDFEYDNHLYRPVTLPLCGHTMCGQCIDIIRKQNKCPQDQISFGTNIQVDHLPTNYPLLIMLYDSSKVKTKQRIIEMKYLFICLFLVSRRR